MRKITKLAVLISVFLVLIISFALFKSCGDTKVDKSGFNIRKSDITKSSTQNKKIQKEDPINKEKSSSSTDKKTPSSSSTESSSEEAQNSNTVEQNQNSNTVDHNQNSNAVNQGGAWEATSGTLVLYKDTPVYAEPNKESGVVYTHPKGEIEWYDYVYENGEWWYTFLEKGGNEATQFYIAYSDVNH
ncbi:hypothetical protein [Streptococcus pluranimalium]|uniref:hypothetical protein n=1 Tax=Streptococcus pluranimalium TaxID=82348 RepID=UPI003F66C2ED